MGGPSGRPGASGLGSNPAAPTPRLRDRGQAPRPVSQLPRLWDGDAHDTDSAAVRIEQVGKCPAQRPPRGPRPADAAPLPLGSAWGLPSRAPASLSLRSGA